MRNADVTYRLNFELDWLMKMAIKSEQNTALQSQHLRWMGPYTKDNKYLKEVCEIKVDHANDV